MESRYHFGWPSGKPKSLRVSSSGITCLYMQPCCIKSQPPVRIQYVQKVFSPGTILGLVFFSAGQATGAGVEAGAGAEAGVGTMMGAGATTGAETTTRAGATTGAETTTGAGAMTGAETTTRAGTTTGAGTGARAREGIEASTPLYISLSCQTMLDPQNISRRHESINMAFGLTWAFFLPKPF